MAHLKLTIDDFYSNDFELIAIHTTLEDYKLAYLINQNLEISLHKSHKEISIQSQHGTGFFSWFVYEDCKHDLGWNLLSNKTQVANTNSNIGLFNEDQMAFHLIPELKRAEYLLKIENLDERFNTQKVIENLTKINKIITSYIVDTSTVKSINNLIF